MVDCCSRLVAGFVSMPIKNAILIYQFVFRPEILRDQVRMDHGREFCFVIFVQQVIAYLRAEVRRAQFKQTTSTDNNVAERFWPKVNRRMYRSFLSDNTSTVYFAILRCCKLGISLYFCKNQFLEISEKSLLNRVGGYVGNVGVWVA